MSEQLLTLCTKRQQFCYSVKYFLAKLLLGFTLTALFDYWLRPPPLLHNVLPTDLSLSRLNLHNETPKETLEREVRVLCWVMTTPKNHKTKAIHVQRTWGKRCNRLLFVTSQPDDELETIIVPIEDTYQNIWGKTREAFRYVYQHHKDEAEWFMKADDDTFVFVENLRYLLYPYTTDMPIYFGYPFKLLSNPKKVYMSGGSGYVLSKEALRRFVEVGMNDSSKCCIEYENKTEDVEMGACLNAVVVVAGDSRDSMLRLRFYPFEPYSVLKSNTWGKQFWFHTYSYYRFHNHRDALSPYAVAFHYVDPEEMYVYDFMMYDFSVFGLNKALTESLPVKLKPEEVVIPPSDNL